MAPLYEIYQLKSEDTLESLAAFLGISVQDVIKIHNRYANLEDRISDDIPGHLTELYVEYNEAKIQQHLATTDRQRLKRYDFLHLFRPRNIDHSFVVTMNTYKEDEDPDAGREIQFNISIKWLYGNEKHQIIQLTRNQFHVGNKEPGAKADELAMSCAAAQYPIQLVLRNDGKITGINNCSEIYTRWQQVKESLLDMYEDEFSLKYISITEQIYSNPVLLQEQLMKQLYLHLLFQPVNIKYDLLGRAEQQLGFPVFPLRPPIMFRVNQQAIVREHNENIAIEQKGITCDSRTLQEIILDKDTLYFEDAARDAPVDGSLECIHVISSTSGITEQLYATFTITFPGYTHITSIRIEKL